MKVVQINTVCGTGSTGRIATDIYSTLKNYGIKNYIIYGRGEPRFCDDAIKISDKLDFYSHALQTRIFDAHGFCSQRATEKALKILNEINPDIVHLHNIHGYYINVESLFSYFKQHSHIKVIWTLHDCWSFTGHCAHFDYSGCEKWKTHCSKCPQKHVYPTSNFIDNSISNFQRKKDAFIGVENLTIITPSHWLADLVKKSYLKKYPIEVINNGIDLSIFCHRESDFRARYGLENKFIIMGAASEWSPRKGFDDIIELANRLPASFKFVIVGLPLDKIKKLPDNIIGIHRTDNPIELAEIYTAADVFFNPTYEDNYPTVNLESISCGTPVITYNTGGSPESVSANHGFVVGKGDLSAVVDILSNLSIHPFKITKSTIPSCFDKNVFVESMISLYGIK